MRRLVLAVSLPSTTSSYFKKIHLQKGIIACNLGYVYGNITAISQNLICEDVAGTGDFTTLYECECCEFSWPISKYVSPATPSKMPKKKTNFENFHITNGSPAP